METCEYCKWYYKEHCCNGLSENCTEMVAEDDNCKWLELNTDEYFQYGDKRTRLEVPDIDVGKEGLDETIRNV